MVLVYDTFHFLRSTTRVSTISPHTSWQDDTEALIDFSTPGPRIMLVVYNVVTYAGTPTVDLGYNIRLEIDGVEDSDFMAQSPRSSNRANGATIFYIGEISSGDHRIQGRFMSNEAYASSIDERQLAVVLFEGTAEDYAYIQSSVNEGTTSELFVDDPQAILNISSLENFLMLALYVCTHIRSSAEKEHIYGKKAGIMVDGVDVARQDSSPNQVVIFDSSTMEADSNTVIWMGVYGAGAHNIKGRFASNSEGDNVFIHHRRLGVLLLDPETLNDFIESAVKQVHGVPYNALEEDTQAIVNRSLTEPADVLVIYNPCNYHGGPIHAGGRRSVVEVDGSIVAEGHQSPGLTDYKCSETVVWMQSLAAGAHTIKGKWMQNWDFPQPVLDERQLAVLYLRALAPPPGKGILKVHAFIK